MTTMNFFSGVFFSSFFLRLYITYTAWSKVFAECENWNRSREAMGGIRCGRNAALRGIADRQPPAKWRRWLWPGASLETSKANTHEIMLDRLSGLHNHYRLVIGTRGKKTGSTFGTLFGRATVTCHPRTVQKSSTWKWLFLRSHLSSA